MSENEYELYKIPQPSITYNRFSTISNYNFNIRFPKSRMDICQLYYKYEIKLKDINNLNFSILLKKAYFDHIKRAE